MKTRSRGKEKSFKLSTGTLILDSCPCHNVPVASVFLDNLTPPSLFVVFRINSIHSLSTIAIALGPDRTRSELLPYILELLDDESEVLAELATVLGQMLDVVGGP